MMGVYTSESFAGHEAVVHCHDARSGLRAIIAIHDRTLGPALGGCRRWSYASEAEALEDVLRLSEGMTWKNALAGLPLGGGKAVIMADSDAGDRGRQWRAFAEAVDMLGGHYITAQDVGVSAGDIVEVSRFTRYAAGVDRRTGRPNDPSPMTALGVFHGIQAAVDYRLGQSDLKGVRVLVQGLGNVGTALCRHLSQAGARLHVNDTDLAKVDRAVSAFGARAVPADVIFDTEAEVYAPCALGGTLTRASIERLRAPVVAGGANNQLQEAQAGRWLHEKGILYAPDYVINAGGVIAVAADAVSGMDQCDVRARVAGIADTLRQIFARSEREGVATSEIADRMARARVEAARADAAAEPRLTRSG